MYLSLVENAQSSLAQVKTTLDAMSSAGDSALVDKAQTDLSQVSDDLDALHQYITNMPQPTSTPRGARGAGGRVAGGTGFVPSNRTSTSVPQNVGNPAMQSVLLSLERASSAIQRIPVLPTDDTRKKAIDDLSQMQTDILVALSPDAKTDASAAPVDAAAQPEPLTGDQLKAIVLVEGDAEEGTGFIAKMHGQYFIVTNQHVLSGNKKFTLTGMDGTQIPTTGPLYGAVGYDVAILKIPDSFATHYFEVMDDPQTNAKADQAVSVPGNSSGARVPIDTKGKILGVGPELVEVDAKFVPGNSGSPIIYRPTNQVVGIATFAILYKLDPLKKAANAASTRWFGYRIDNIKKWEIIDWKRFSDEGIKVEEVEDMSKLLIALLDGDKLPAIDNDSIKTAIATFREDIAVAEAHHNDNEVIDAVQGFNNRLHHIADSDIDELSQGPLYSYHADKLKEQLELRKEIDTAFLDINKEASALVGSLN